MPRWPDIAAVVLDAGGVLLLPDPVEVRRAMAPFGVEPDDDCCNRAHYAAGAELDRLWCADYRAADRAIAITLGIPEAHLDEATAAVDPLYVEHPWVPVAGAAEALRALERAGYALAIVSNAHGSIQEQLAGHEICSTSEGPAARVSVVVDSAVVGIAKPDPRIFEVALDALGLPARQCLYVGDTTYFDVAGARAAGMHPVHLDPYGFCRGDAHDHVASLQEIVAALGTRGRDGWDQRSAWRT